MCTFLPVHRRGLYALALLLTGAAAAGAGTGSASLSPGDIADRVRTRIVVLKRSSGGGAGYATGFLVSSRLVVTAGHAAAPDGSLTAYLNGIRYGADYLNRHPREDIALLRLAAGDLLIRPAPLADTAARLRPGEPLYIVTGPAQQDGRLSDASRRRIIPARFSAFVRPRDENEPAEQGRYRLRLQAQVLPGDSGSPVLSTRGEVVGVLTSRAAPGGAAGGTAYAVPVEMVHSWIEQLAEREHRDDDVFYLLRAAGRGR